VAESAHLSERVVASMDMKKRELLADWLAGFATRNYISSTEYKYHLAHVIGAIAHQGGAVIVGRGAHLLLPEALKVRVVASPDTRVRNLVHFEGLSETEARRRIKASDRERQAFLWDLAARLGHSRFAGEGGEEHDLILNTDRFALEEAASMILVAAERFFALSGRAPSIAHRRAAAVSGVAIGAP
jgi:cytidylate kinase